MRLFTGMQAFWQQRRLRIQLMVVIAMIGLFALLLNAVLLGTFLNGYLLDRQGTQIAQQAEALGQCCKEDRTFLFNAPPQVIAHFMQIALADAPGRRVVIISARGLLRYATPMPSALLQTLLAHERHNFMTTANLATTAPSHWERLGDQIVADVRISDPGTTGSNSREHVVGEVLLDEDQQVGLSQWNKLFALVILSTGIAIVLTLLGGIIAGRILARPLIEVTEVAQDIATGDYTRRVTVTPVGPSEMHKLGLSFNRMMDEVLHQRRVERDLLANVSHELASPLGLIRGYAEALLDGVIDDNSQRLTTLRAISTEATRLARLSGDLLDLASLETGQIAIHSEAVPVNELLMGLYERFTPLAQQKGIVLTFESASNLPLVQTDGLRLEQVLVNLLNNALHSTSAQGEIFVSAAHVGTHIQLRVSDTGKGIPSEKLFRIWERFYQVDTARDRRTGAAGVGLGLAVCRGIITRLHGSITVESTVGKGTIFTILLPVS